MATKGRRVHAVIVLLAYALAHAVLAIACVLCLVYLAAKGGR